MLFKYVFVLWACVCYLEHLQQKIQNKTNHMKAITETNYDEMAENESSTEVIDSLDGCLKFLLMSIIIFVTILAIAFYG